MITNVKEAHTQLVYLFRVPGIRVSALHFRQAVCRPPYLYEGGFMRTQADLTMQTRQDVFLCFLRRCGDPVCLATVIRGRISDDSSDVVST